VAYLHAEIKRLERIEIIRDLRVGNYDVLGGINLLREGLDIPEVSLVAILDADKEGFLRSERSLIQTMGRAARNENGEVVMYGDKVTSSMEGALDEPNRRREKQMTDNERYNITPKTIRKDVRDVIQATVADEDVEDYEHKKTNIAEMTKTEKAKMIDSMEKEMKEAAKALDFEKAAELRDIVLELKAEGA